MDHALAATRAGPRPVHDDLRPHLDALPVGAYTCDPAGHITYFNPPAAALWGRTPRLNDPADLYCGSYRLHTPGGDPVPRDRCWMALALRDGAGYNGRGIVVERPDGTRRLALAHANPVRDAAGTVRGGVNVMFDAAADATAGLAEVVARLLTSLASARPLAGLIPVCGHCRKVRDGDAWHQIEAYLKARTDAAFTHGICPACVAVHFPEYDAGPPA